MGYYSRAELDAMLAEIIGSFQVRHLIAFHDCPAVVEVLVVNRTVRVRISTRMNKRDADRGLELIERYCAMALARTPLPTEPRKPAEPFELKS